MTIVGEAFVAISPESAAFASKLEAQLKGAGLGQVVTDLIGPAAVIGVTASLAVIGNQFDKLTKQIRQETGATGNELTGLVDDATAAFRKVPASLGDAGEAVSELFRRGVPVGGQLTHLAEQELFLAKITKEQLAPTVEATTSLMAKFNVPLSDQSRELDVLFRGYQASGKGLGALLQNLQSGGAVLQQFGFNLDESTALLALLAKAGVNVAPALAGLRIGFAKIVAEGASPKKVLSDLIAEFQAGKDPTKAMADAIALFGKRSGSELAVAISKGKFAVGPFLKQITDGRGGIIETGLATLTLGDQFKLLRNNVQADLAGLGTAVLHDLESALSSASVPLETLITGVAHFTTSLAPAAQGAALLLVPLELLLPIAKDLGIGFDAVSTILGHLPTPVLAVAGAVTIGVLAWNAYKDATLAALIVTEAFDKVVEFAGSPLGIFLIAVTALGAALSAFSQRHADVTAAAKDITAGIFESSSATNLFTGNVDSATKALQNFFVQQSQNGKLASGLRAGLHDSGTSAVALGSAITGSDAGFRSFRDDVVAATNAASKFPVPLGTISLQAGITLQALNAEREGFRKAAQQQLDNLVTTGQLTSAQEKQIIATSTSKDGTLDYAKALDTANATLQTHIDRQNAVVIAQTKTKKSETELTTELASGAITDAIATKALKDLGFAGDAVAQRLAILKLRAEELNQARDLEAGKLVPLTQKYHDLAAEIGQGVVTQDAAERSLVKMGFSATGAKTAFSALQSQITSFVSSAVSKLPDAAKVISDLNSAKTTDTSKLQSDLAQRVSLQQQLGTQLTTGGAATEKALSNINAKITLDQTRINDGQAKTTTTLENDQLRRSQILSNASKSGGQASASLAAAIHKNDAAILADQKKVAEDNSIDTFTKRLLQNTVQIVTFQANLQKLVTEGFGQLAGVLAQQGPEAAAALAAGFAGNQGKASFANAAVVLGKHTADNFSKFLGDNVAQLALPAATVGNAVGKGIVDGVSVELLKRFPEIHRFGVDIGTEVGKGLTEGLSPVQVATVLKQHGESGGAAFGQGLIDGLNTKTTLLYRRVVEVAGQVEVEIRNAWVVKSPSRVAAEISGLFVEGLALGFTENEPKVVAAAKHVAAAVTSATRTSFGPGPVGSFPVTPPALLQPALHPSLIQSGVSLPNFSGLSRPDAVAQMRALLGLGSSPLPPPIASPPHGPSFPDPIASPPHGPFAGATIQFPEKTDPQHIASELAWRFQNP